MAVSIDLGGQVAIVTGGNRGLGFAIAETLAEAGAQVVIIARNQEENEKAVAKVTSRGLRCSGVSADVTDTVSVQQAVGSILDQFGKIDILVNSAGVDITVPATEATEEQWRKIMDTNLKGAFFFCQLVGRSMVERRKGKIVSIASILSQVVKVNEALYGASKGGLVQMSRCLAAEWAPYNINVNVISPGSVPTELNRTYLSVEENRQRNLRKIPMGRLGTPAEIAGVALFLVSDLASYVTGQNIFVDGGWTLGW
ncbi:SDR family NAD(P)-dependent oxidoreductase [Gelria sp. Kuro-4]|uniref:SDR family NAD(P)-dependent oxidoreductase n=1 Tax=Gelria sp. Kuro-4 TaxID=2796927 RepID=UPI001BEE4727|nr:glucose 1-dehydrogenase [Gelria sp. Kuro-4]BCV24890.1 short-chain dehydrogenase [Gelria sp. Kuro-4]